MKWVKTALAPLGDEQRTECLELLRQWKRRTWLTVLLTVSAVLIPVLIAENASPAFDFWTSATLFMIPGALVNVIVLSLQQKKFLRRLSEMPEMAQALHTNAPQFTALGGGITAAAPGPDIGQYVLAVLLCIVFFPVGILYVIHLDRKRREQAVNILTPGDALARAADSHARTLGCGSFLLIVFCGGAMLLAAMMGSVASSKLSTLNTSARFVCNAANAYLTEMYEKCTPIAVPAGTYIIHGTDTFEEGSLEWGIEQYFPDVRRYGWYALEFDDSGNVVAAWISKKKLTESDLIPTDRDEQRKLLRSFTHQDEAIGYYAKSAGSPQDPHAER